VPVRAPGDGLRQRATAALYARMPISDPVAVAEGVPGDTGRIHPGRWPGPSVSRLGATAVAAALNLRGVLSWPTG